jgi:acetyl CoA:N6-hydroxylysine acetyl transferase
MNEVVYSPLSQNEKFHVKREGDICTVKTQSDLYLESKLELLEDTLTLNFQSANSDNLGLLLAFQVEFLLSASSEVKKVNLSNFQQLAFPFNQLGSTFLRSEFFQLPLMWHAQPEYKIKPERWSETDGRSHPVRDSHPEGYVYKRFIPLINKTVSFRMITVDDLDIFHEWHNQPRVSFFWELNQSKEELKAYIEKVLKDPHQIPMIVELDNEPAGYFEFYWAREDRLGPYYESDDYDRGFHFLIGNKKFLGSATTDSIVRSCLHFLYLDDPRTRRVMAEPRHDNQKVLKYAELSVGWRKVKIFDFPHKRAWLLENSRGKFFEGNAL